VQPLFDVFQRSGIERLYQQSAGLGHANRGQLAELHGASIRGHFNLEVFDQARMSTAGADAFEFGFEKIDGFGHFRSGVFFDWSSRHKQSNSKVQHSKFKEQLFESIFER
jgi:hypothetical protein